MPVVTMPVGEATSQKALSSTLGELCRFLSSFPGIQMSEEDCQALAVTAVSGHAEAEFMIASVFDAAGEDERAIEWYSRSAARNYLPAMLQLLALR